LNDTAGNIYCSHTKPHVYTLNVLKQTQASVMLATAAGLSLTAFKPTIHQACIHTVYREQQLH